jgi:hypothetical protein
MNNPSFFENGETKVAAVEILVDGKRVIAILVVPNKPDERHPLNKD